MGIRGRLICLVLGIFTAMVTIGMFDLYRVWNSNQIQLKDSLRKRTQIAARAFELWSKGQQEPLNTLSEIISDRPIRSAIVDSNLVYLLETRPKWTNLQIVDKTGKTISKYTKGKEIPQSLVEDLLTKTQENKSLIFASDRTEGDERPIFTITASLKDNGAIILQIDGESIKELFNEIELGENTVIAVLNKDGRILYRRSSDETSLYSEIVGTSLIEALGDKKLIVTEIKSPYDGIPRVYGISRTDNSENVVVIGIPSKRFYEPLWQQIYRQIRISLIIFLVAVAVTLFLSYGILKSLRNLKEATYRFAEGNRDAKAPISIAGEIGELGKAFNWMAEQINEREDRLRALDELKSEFVSSVSHELKTPLTTIKTLTHVLRENKISPQERAEYLEVIGTECDRQILLVTNILDLSMIESGKYNYQLGEVNLQTVLSDVFNLEKPNAQLNNNKLELKLTGEIPKVQANAEAYQRVFRLLLENSIKYTPENGTVVISNQNLEKEVAVSITDSGCGIDIADLPHIFDKFYRGKPNGKNSETNSQSNGVGLGLYVSKKIVEQLGGNITATNGLSGGTIFTVKLPIWRGGEND